MRWGVSARRAGERTGRERSAAAERQRPGAQRLQRPSGPQGAPCGPGPPPGWARPPGARRGPRTSHRTPGGLPGRGAGAAAPCWGSSARTSGRTGPWAARPPGAAGGGRGERRAPQARAHTCRPAAALPRARRGAQLAWASPRAAARPPSGRDGASAPGGARAGRCFCALPAAPRTAGAAHGRPHAGLNLRAPTIPAGLWPSSSPPAPRSRRPWAACPPSEPPQALYPRGAHLAAPQNSRAPRRRRSGWLFSVSSSAPVLNQLIDSRNREVHAAAALPWRGSGARHC